MATISSPHEGTDFATAAAALERTPGGSTALAAIAPLWDSGVAQDGASSVLDMAETSAISRSAERDFPDSVRLLTLGARGDLTVPAGHTRLDGIDHRTLSVMGVSAHSELPGAADTTRELALALEGRAPTCESWLDGLDDAVVPEAISYGEDMIGAGATALGMGVPVSIG